ncbi:hypothetical protein Pmar_PMAR001818 [Perkinsus marinus ATCC 50983]|uniref:RING-type domain-containing protein n=1 Tax=Perkinsus marinus (strain ATCC 50983 / TXsc) TaxID=423536 RepID=C5LJQ7_PERM5|nr:hypothetical protein Pmar_PMAR001818 [Perkinsus marinus ATCC 50983]EER03074.1 hypothetical protein Pmar_PMAR001818 [Perkinsus marinus ATCC 50983]|eukprot:XP_002771258.1 hypothetical protein Pmar_PMAR001818 [Perkinsus marinus ATCC 50983]
MHHKDSNKRGGFVRTNMYIHVLTALADHADHQRRRRHQHQHPSLFKDIFHTGVWAPEFRAMWYAWLIMYISLGVFIGISGEKWSILIAYLAFFGVLPPIAIIKHIFTIKRKQAAERNRQSRDRALELANDKLATEEWLKNNCERMMGDDPRCICYCKDECAICLSDYHPSDVLILLPCHHVYHLQCIKMLLDSPMSYDGNAPRCPLCRARLGDEVLMPEPAKTAVVDNAAAAAGNSAIQTLQEVV